MVEKDRHHDMLCMYDLVSYNHYVINLKVDATYTHTYHRIVCVIAIIWITFTAFIDIIRGSCALTKIVVP